MMSEVFLPFEPVCFLHGSCMDGFTSEWVLHKFYGEQAEYHQWSYNKPIPLSMVRHRNVIMADFSCKRDEMQEIIKAAQSVLVLDHHKTAEEELVGLGENIHFDMHRSGAGMTWDHFFERKERPWLVSYVEDRDLWKWNLKGSPEVNALIQATSMTIQNWDELDKLPLDEAYKMGAAIRLYIDNYCKVVADTARFVEFGGVSCVPVVNVTYHGISDVLNHLLIDYGPLAVGWHQNKLGGYYYSLRSKGDFDCSEIAKEYGGGGHRNAAGFSTDTPIF